MFSPNNDNRNIMNASPDFGRPGRRKSISIKKNTQFSF
jgi:hypothetical protein